MFLQVLCKNPLHGHFFCKMWTHISCLYKKSNLLEVQQQQKKNNQKIQNHIIQLLSFHLRHECRNKNKINIVLLKEKKKPFKILEPKIKLKKKERLKH